MKVSIFLVATMLSLHAQAGSANDKKNACEQSLSELMYLDEANVIAFDVKAAALARKVNDIRVAHVLEERVQLALKALGGYGTDSPMTNYDIVLSALRTLKSYELQYRGSLDKDLEVLLKRIDTGSSQ
jgi:hypothetical protein